MAPLPDLIISSIKEILDKTENIEDKITRHNNVQNSLLELFKGLGYNGLKVAVEYENHIVLEWLMDPRMKISILIAKRI